MLVDRISRTNNSTGPAHRLSRLIAASTLGRQLTVEFIGTFILVLTVGLSTSSKGAGDLALLAIGSVDEARAEVSRLLTDHRDQLESLTHALLAAETLDAADAYAAAQMNPQATESEPATAQGRVA